MVLVIEEIFIVCVCVSFTQKQILLIKIAYISIGIGQHR